MFYLTIIGAVFLAWIIVVTLFTPAVPYHLEKRINPEDNHFINVLESTCQARLLPGNSIEILTNGEAFYPAMLDAIASARESISMECYIFKRGDIGDRFIRALSERARAGVRVTIVLDFIGSFSAWKQAATALTEAGCRVERYQAMHWYRLARLNNRTHRELLVVDGRVAFAGGAGVADWWWKPARTRWWRPVGGRTAWRDMMARIEGPLVADIQGVIAENWIECCGEILSGHEVYKPPQPAGESSAFAVRSSPSDRITASRVLFQTLVESARDTLVIATPYFLPGTAAHGETRRPDHGDRARRAYRSEMGAPRQPETVRAAAPRRGADLRIRRRHDARQGAHRRRPVVGHRHDERRQPLFRAQRRGQRRRPRREGRVAPDGRSRG